MVENVLSVVIYYFSHNKFMLCTYCYDNLTSKTCWVYELVYKCQSKKCRGTFVVSLGNYFWRLAVLEDELKCSQVSKMVIFLNLFANYCNATTRGKCLDKVISSDKNCSYTEGIQSVNV